MKVIKAEPIVSGFVVTIVDVEMMDRKEKLKIEFKCGQNGDIILAVEDGVDEGNPGLIIGKSDFKKYFSPKMIQRIRSLCLVQVNKLIFRLKNTDWGKPPKWEFKTREEVK